MKAFRLSLLVLPLIAAGALAQNSGGASANQGTTTTVTPIGSTVAVEPPFTVVPVTPINPDISIVNPAGGDAGTVVKAATGETRVSLDVSFGIRYVPPSRISVPAGEKLTIVAPFASPVVVSGDANGAAPGATTVASTIGSGQSVIWTRNGVAIPGAASAVLVIDSVQSSDAGTYACLLATPTTQPQPSQSLVLGVGPTSRLINVSIRGALPAGSGQSFIAGFVVAGTQSKRVLVRAVGATLARFNVPNPLQRPLLRIYDATGKELASPIDPATYGTELAAAVDSTGAFPLDPGSGNAVRLMPFTAGAYTAQVTSADGSGGEVLVEIYELP